MSMLLLNPPRDEESLRKFIEELRGRGARLLRMSRLGEVHEYAPPQPA